MKCMEDIAEMFRKASTWTATFLACVGAALSVSAGAERIEVLIDQAFAVDTLDSDVWEASGALEFTGDALHTKSILHTDTQSVSAKLASEPIPTAHDTYFLRIEYAMTPLKTDIFGSDIRLKQGPFLMQMEGNRAKLNHTWMSKEPIAMGERIEVRADFNAHGVMNWVLNGDEQLSEPVLAMRAGAESIQLALSDYGHSQSETLWHYVRLSRVYPDDELTMTLSGWHELPLTPKGEPVSFVTAIASPMEKVFREAPYSMGTIGAHVNIAAAGRESESFQVVILPTGPSLSGVNVTVSDLVHRDGDTRLSSDHVAWHPVGYIETDPTRSTRNRVGWGWPEYLAPSEPFAVESGFAQPLWFTVTVPHGTKPGMYRGVISIAPEGQSKQVVGLELRVRDYSLPLRGALKTAICYTPEMWETWYQRKFSQEEWRRVYDFLLAHHVSPTFIYNGMGKDGVRVFPAMEDMQYCYDRGMTATCLGCVHPLPEDPVEAEATLEKMAAHLAEWEPFVKEKNWPDFTWYVHGFDESEGIIRKHPEQRDRIYDSIAKWSALFKERFPWLKFETANPPHEGGFGGFDIWTPTTDQHDERDEIMYQKVLDHGDEIWAYVCNGPVHPFANLLLEFPGVDPRILSWQLFQHDLTGFLYYMTNWYVEQENYDKDAPKWPERRWVPWNAGANGDGMLIYPGPDGLPLASTRLENFRDGMEDYEALVILRDRCAALEAKGGHEKLVKKAKKVLAVRPEITDGWKSYTKDPAVLQAARTEVDALIEGLGDALNGKGRRHGR
jgi:Glycoside hydrolase 123, catalytic domain/Glycoside hydrolase 123 N-terminal domain